jgi:hypothetical protein
MTPMSLGLTDLPPVTTTIIGIVVLTVGIVAYENWRLMRMRRRSAYQGAGLTGVYPRYRPWQELSPRMRALRVIMFICWAVGLVSLCTVGSIETAALRQPKIADAQFIHPHSVKGTVRFFTERQEGIYAVAKPLMIGFWAVGLAFMVMLNRVEQNWREQKQRDLLDRFTSEV